MECNDLPNRLRELREARGLKRPQLAVDLDVDPTTVYRWETGRGPMDDATKLRVAEYFGVSPAYLMGWETEGAAA